MASASVTISSEADEAAAENGVVVPTESTQTLYLHNLNEKVQIPVLKETLRTLFKPYKPLGEVVAHRNVRMRGQAFVSFHDKESAERAKADVDEFPLYGKPMVGCGGSLMQIIAFAKTRSDVVVKQSGDDVEEWKKHRLEEKSACRGVPLTAEKNRKGNPWRVKQLEKAKSGVEPVAKKARVTMPDEYLPPNNVLFVQNLPEGTTQDDLRDVFEQHAGLTEIRTIPSKRDIAFIEFADEATATVAKDALHNFKIDGETKMKVGGEMSLLITGHVR